MQIELYGEGKRPTEVVAHAVVDDDQTHLLRWRWRLDKGGYAVRRASGQRILMHREILKDQLKPDLISDHINRDRLDNRRLNLRVVAHAQSAHNQGPNRFRGLGVRGVRYQRRKTDPDHPYRAVVGLNGKTHYVGYYATVEEAGVTAAQWRAQHMSHAVDSIGILDRPTPTPGFPRSCRLCGSFLHLANKLDLCGQCQARQRHDRFLSRKTSCFVGVGWNQEKRKWVARGPGSTFIGYFSSEAEAVRGLGMGINFSASLAANRATTEKTRGQ